MSNIDDERDLRHLGFVFFKDEPFLEYAQELIRYKLRDYIHKCYCDRWALEVIAREDDRVNGIEQGEVLVDSRGGGTLQRFNIEERPSLKIRQGPKTSADVIILLADLIGSFEFHDHYYRDEVRRLVEVDDEPGMIVVKPKDRLKGRAWKQVDLQIRMWGGCWKRKDRKWELTSSGTVMKE